MEANAEAFRDPTRLTLWVRRLLYVQVAVALTSIVTGTMEYSLLHDYQVGNFATEAEAVAAGEASDLRQGMVAILYLTTFVVSGVLILIWIQRANYNARQLGATGMKFTPGWAVGWYFVPIATLWKPYQAMKEIWRASHDPANWQDAPVSALVSGWWALWIISNIVGQAVFRLSLRAEGLDELMMLNRIYLVSDVLDIALSFITLALVTSIYKAQLSHGRQAT